MREEIVALEDDADALAQPAQVGRRIVHRLAVDDDLAALDRLEPVDAAQQRALAEPERPMTAMISPGSTASETSSSTVLLP